MPVTVAVNFWVVPFITSVVEGDTVTSVTFGGGFITLTVEVEYTSLYMVEVALTTMEAAVSFAATESRPSTEIVVSLLLLPDMLHVTVVGAPCSTFTVGVNFCVEPFVTVALVGDKVMLVTKGILTETLPRILVFNTDSALT